MLHNDTSTEPGAFPTNPSIWLQAFADWTVQWHATPGEAGKTMVQQLHWANFTLWHLEDFARDQAATDHAIATCKRNIDMVNQERNDTVEQLDRILLQQLAANGLLRNTAPLHSETPGMILDRLSILALKLFHTAEEVARTDAGEAHRLHNLERLHILQQQNNDLGQCLVTLIGEVERGERRFQLYRQMKMYNDPDLNPILYGARAVADQSGAA